MPAGRIARTALLVALATSSVLGVGSGRAEPSSTELAAARKRFVEGIQREEAGDWAGALEIFREVAAVKANHIVRFHLALCLEKTGRLVDALEAFAQAKVQAEKEGGTDAELTIANAKKHVDALRARIPSVRVDRPHAAGATIAIDGAPALFEAAIPLDPGVHRVQVAAPGHLAFVSTVTLVDGAIEPVVVTPTLVKVAAAAPVASSAPTRDVPPRAGTSTWTWIAAGASVASLAGASVLYALRASTLAELDASCAPDRSACDPAKRGLEDRGRGYTIAGNVLLGVGAAAATAAIVLFATEPSKAGGNSSAFSVRAGITPFGAAVQARF